MSLSNDFSQCNKTRDGIVALQQGQVKKISTIPLDTQTKIDYLMCSDREAIPLIDPLRGAYTMTTLKPRLKAVNSLLDIASLRKQFGVELAHRGQVRRGYMVLAVKSDDEINDDGSPKILGYRLSIADPENPRYISMGMYDTREEAQNMGAKVVSEIVAHLATLGKSWKLAPNEFPARVETAGTDLEEVTETETDIVDEIYDIEPVEEEEPKKKKKKNGN